MAENTVFFFADAGAMGKFYVDLDYRSEDIKAEGVLLDAIIVGALESLTQSIEYAIDCPLDWKAMAVSGNAKPAAGLELLVSYDQSVVVSSARFILPLSCLPLLENWTTHLNNGLIAYKWTPVRVSVQLSNLELSDEECADLSLGALVMIPESFKKTWLANVCLGEYEMAGSYRATDDLWIRDDQARLNKLVVCTPDSRACESSARHSKDASNHSLTINHEIDPIELLQQGACITDVLASALNGESDLHTELSGLHLTLPDGECFLAHILPLGDGQAVLLQNKKSTAA